MRRFFGFSFCVLLALTPLVLHVAEPVAMAATAYASPYTYEQTWGAAVRLLRVDLGLKITEKDPEHGYMLFEYTSPESGKRVHSGSLEVVKSGHDKDIVHVSVQLPTMPSYHERMIVDALAKKLYSEHGDPPKRPDPPPPVAPDAGPGDESP